MKGDLLIEYTCYYGDILDHTVRQEHGVILANFSSD